MDQMSLRYKVGQLFMCGFDGYAPTDDITRLIQDYQIGGVIYFRRNIGTLGRVHDLSCELQQLADIPLFITVDQEGGMVARIDHDVTLAPGNMALGAAGNADYVYKACRVSGQELRALGINMNLAPSLDVNNNANNPVIGVRSFGEDPGLVERMGRAAVRGFQDSGISAVAKHFPGHGDTDTDSHYSLPIIKHDMNRLNQIELAPFVGAIEEGVDAIMTAHVLFPAFEESEVPATLSHRVLTGLLRQKLGYRGIIMSDCLEMKAISEGVGVAEGAIQTILAGADIVLVSHTFALQTEAIEAVVNAVLSGRISIDRIDESVARILKLKEERKLADIVQEVQHVRLQERIGEESNRIEMERISEATTTLVKDEHQLPLQNEPTLVIWTEVRESTQVDEVIPQDETLGAILSTDFDVTELRMGILPNDAEINEVLATSTSFRQIVFASYNAAFSPGQCRIVRALAARDDVKLIVAAIRNPYDLQQFPNVKTYIACYENRPMAMRSLAKVLLGSPAQGKLPVTIPKIN